MALETNGKGEEILWKSPRRSSNWAAHRVRLSQKWHKGRRYIDLRLEFKRDHGELGPGQWMPSKKGVTLRADDLESLAAVLLQLARQADDGRP